MKKFFILSLILTINNSLGDIVKNRIEYNQEVNYTLNQPIQFEDFTLTFSKKETNLHPGKSTNSNYNHIYIAKDSNGTTTEIKVKYGQIPPQPQEFKITGKTFILYSYKAPNGENLFPDKIFILKKQSIVDVNIVVVNNGIETETEQAPGLLKRLFKSESKSKMGLQIEVEIKNNKETDFQLDPLLGGPSIMNSIFEIHEVENNKEVPYQGMMKKRAKPDDSDFIYIKPGKTYKAVFTITKDTYTLDSKINYKIKLNVNNHFSKDDIFLTSDWVDLKRK